ncbi:ATP-binding protein [Streptomyces sp. NEAU-W12]|uniref:ATP-binding protein n=1 Tax=Streptomyces sp. NEAU-W12 TaxID=2994668 RepID=UPI003A4C5538
MTAQPAQQDPVTVRVFTRRFSSTPRGARLARHLAVRQLHAWGVPYGTDVSDAVVSTVGEFAANAVTHGRVPGRDFELALTRLADRGLVEVTDTRTGPPCPPDPGGVGAPHPGGVGAPPPLDGHGRGLLLVEALAARRSASMGAARTIDAQEVRFYGPFELAIAVRHHGRALTPTARRPACAAAPSAHAPSSSLCPLPPCSRSCRPPRRRTPTPAGSPAPSSRTIRR